MFIYDNNLGKCPITYAHVYVLRSLWLSGFSDSREWFTHTRRGCFIVDLVITQSHHTVKKITLLVNALQCLVLKVRFTTCIVFQYYLQLF